MPLSLLAGPANAGKVALLLERYLAALQLRSDPDRAEPAGRRPRRARTARPAPERWSAARSAPSTTSSSRSRAGTAHTGQCSRAPSARCSCGASWPAHCGRSARFSGFADSLGSTLSELESALLEPGELEGELAELYSAYREELDRLGVWDRELERRHAAERAAAHPLPPLGDLRGARARADHAPPGHPRGAARHVRRARPPGDDRHLTRLGRDRDRADAGAPVRRTTHACVDQGLRNYWGYNTIGFFAPHHGYAATGPARPAGAGVPGMVKALHAAGIEVILDVVYNHTAEGNHLGPTLSFKGIDNPAYYRLVEDDPRYYMDYTGTGNSSTCAPARAAADHGLAALLGHRDARRRLPVRPGRHPGPRVLRGGPAVHLLRAGPAGPGGQPGEADRRAVGRRPGRLPGRQLPAAVDRVERQVPRHRARLLARRAGHAGASSPPAHRLGRPLPGRRPPAVRQHQLRHRHDGFTLHDLVSYNDKHNEANGEDNRDGESHNRSWNCGVEGPTDDPEIRRAAGPPAAQLPGHADAVPGRADDRARRRAGPHPARQQQRLLPGQRAGLGRLGPAPTSTLLAFIRSADRAPRAAPGVPPPPVLHRAAGARAATASGCPTSPGSPRRAGDDRTRTGATTSAARRSSSTARASPSAARGERTDDSFLLCFNAHDEPLDFTLPGRGVRREVGGGDRHRRRGRRRTGRSRSTLR